VSRMQHALVVFLLMLSCVAPGMPGHWLGWEDMLALVFVGLEACSKAHARNPAMC
jgi:hypothetical protein